MPLEEMPLFLLWISHNLIGDEGANSLAQALRVNTCLSCLNLPSNSIGHEGANLLAWALRVNPQSEYFFDYFGFRMRLKKNV